MAESQVSLAVLIYFGRIFTVFFSLFEGNLLKRQRCSPFFLAGLLLYKGLTLPFEVERLVTDSVCLIAFLGVDLIRLSVADSGNKAGNYSFNLAAENKFYFSRSIPDWPLPRSHRSSSTSFRLLLPVANLCPLD